MSTDHLHPIGESEIQAAVDLLIDSFQDDPLWRVAVPVDGDQNRSRRAFFECPLRYGLTYGKVYASSPALEGLAVWVPGRLADMSFWRLFRSGAIRAALGMEKESVRKLKILSDTVVPDRKRHMKDRNYWYVVVIGVRTAHQGQGIGSRLMEAITAECDAAGEPLYLETETEANLPFYAKHGFEVIGRVTLPELDLPMWELVREPGGASQSGAAEAPASWSETKDASSRSRSTGAPG
ncbi:MAG: GNAT family N-acetyltransferase [Spirochaetota bacterium]